MSARARRRLVVTSCPISGCLDRDPLDTGQPERLDRPTLSCSGRCERFADRRRHHGHAQSCSYAIRLRLDSADSRDNDYVSIVHAPMMTASEALPSRSRDMERAFGVQTPRRCRAGTSVTLSWRTRAVRGGCGSTDRERKCDRSLARSVRARTPTRRLSTTSSTADDRARRRPSSLVLDRPRRRGGLMGARATLVSAQSGLGRSRHCSKFPSDDHSSGSTAKTSTSLPPGIP